MCKLTSWLWNSLRSPLKPPLGCTEVGLLSRRNPEQNSSAAPLVSWERLSECRLGASCVADVRLQTLPRVSSVKTPNATRLTHSDATIAPHHPPVDTPCGENTASGFTAPNQITSMRRRKAGGGWAEQPDGAGCSCQHEVLFNSRGLFLFSLCHEYSILPALCIWICFKPDRNLTPPPFLWPP